MYASRSLDSSFAIYSCIGLHSFALLFLSLSGLFLTCLLAIFFVIFGRGYLYYSSHRTLFGEVGMVHPG